jgi:hypothetical protein
VRKEGSSSPEAGLTAGTTLSRLRLTTFDICLAVPSLLSGEHILKSSHRLRVILDAIELDIQRREVSEV